MRKISPPRDYSLFLRSLLLLLVALVARPPPAAAAELLSQVAAARAALVAAEGKARAASQRTFEVRYLSSLLADNLQGNSPEARAVVRLPIADCRAAKAQCWLLLYLPGFDADPALVLERTGLGARLDALERGGEVPPLVAVAVDGRTRLGGGFYVDSPSSGRFASLILDALLPALRDGLGAPLPPERSVVVGHSMGGFGALWLASRRPGAFFGVGALSPAGRVEAQAERLVASLEAEHPADSPDPAEAVRSPDPARFRERLLWALCAAFDPAPFPPQGFRLPFDPLRRPWTLTRSARAAFARFDLTRSFDERATEATRALGRVYMASGRGDTLVPPSDVEPLVRALREIRGARPTRVVIHDGDHLTHWALDVEDAVRFLMEPL